VRAENPETGRFLLDNFNLYSQRQRQNLIEEAAKLFKQKPEEAEQEIKLWFGN